jgi:hypothetical protein
MFATYWTGPADQSRDLAETMFFRSLSEFGRLAWRHFKVFPGNRSSDFVYRPHTSSARVGLIYGAMAGMYSV